MAIRTTPQIFHDKGNPWYDAMRRENPDLDRFTKAQFHPTEREHKYATFVGKRKSGQTRALSPKPSDNPNARYERVEQAYQKMLTRIATAKGNSPPSVDTSFTSRPKCGDCTAFVEAEKRCKKLNGITVGRTTLSCRIFSNGKEK